MLENFRRFSVAGAGGRVWDVEFRWHQNAISIRHADAIDCKYYLTCGDERRELVVGLPHPALLEAAGHAQRKVTDAWVVQLGALHVERLISSGNLPSGPIAVVSAAEIAEYEQRLQEERARAASARR